MVKLKSVSSPNNHLTRSKSKDGPSCNSVKAGNSDLNFALRKPKHCPLQRDSNVLTEVLGPDLGMFKVSGRSVEQLDPLLKDVFSLQDELGSFAEIAKGHSIQRFTPLIEERLDEISKGGVLIPDQEAIESNMKKLEFAVVGKILGKKMSYSFIQTELQRKWKRFGDFKFLLFGRVSFICIFSSLGAREAVLNGGPWNIAGHMVGLSKWAPDFDPESMNGLFSPVWVRFPNLPLIYWDKKNINRIASMIGRPIWYDEITNVWGKSSYARVCISLDISKQLPKGTWIQGINGKFFQRCEFEEVPIFCFGCGRIGHFKDNCQEIKPNEQMEVEGVLPAVSRPGDSPAAVLEEETVETAITDHPWVVVKRKVRQWTKQEIVKPISSAQLNADPGDVRLMWRRKGSTFSIGESSGSKEKFVAKQGEEMQRSSVIQKGIVFHDPMRKGLIRGNEPSGAGKGKEEQIDSFKNFVYNRTAKHAVITNESPSFITLEDILVPVDPLEWQLSQDTSNSIAACLANTIGAAESVLRVAATGHDKRLFLKVIVILYTQSVFGRMASGATIAYAGLCFCCIYIFAQNSLIAKFTCKIGRRESTAGAQDCMQTDEASSIK
ncbi:hypothetical protein M5K25_024673 [Dendrobium thyrsiflorum]|uniref:CCHC-type domain-containing protein n=1 Tax=Dendrobium thyrsiflorum TaxID=117978 RepID=A0ABD0U2I7_DENTH